MTNLKSQACKPDVFPVARIIAESAAPWIPITEKKSFKPLRFFGGDRGFVELLRIEPGEAVPLHRHTGEVHVFNLEGSRRLCTGELIGPGEYVYEPAGNIDSWEVVGDTPLIIFAVVIGAVEYLRPDYSVTARVTADTMMELYQRHCAANNVPPADLVD
jgi:quercetin dioxygenase-like cupin family protein